MLANSQMRLGMIVAWYHHGAEECGLHLRGGASPEHAHGLLHHQGIAGQHDSATVSACEAQLLLGHPQELTKSCCAEERQWYLELHAVSGLHYAVWPLPLTSTACCTTLQFLLPTLMTTRGRKQWLEGDDGDG